MKRSLLPFLMLTKVQRIGLLVFAILLLLTEGLFAINAKKKQHFLDTNEENRLVKLEMLFDSLNKLDRNFTSHSTSKKTRNDTLLKPFNPNDLTNYGWVKLGFSARQAEVIMKYKQMIGGTFTSKSQIRKCYVINDEMFATLEPYIQLPEHSKSDEKLAKQQTRKTVNYTKFNPNHYAEQDWVKIGFSPKQAQTILKYKSILGGEFKSKQDLAKCYVISDEKFNEMKSYIDLPDKIEFTSKPKVEIVDEKPKESVTEKKEIVYEKFNPNDLDKEGWMKLGFSEKQANTIIKYKFSLGGKFSDAIALSKSYVISEQKFKEMEPYLVFD